MNTKFIDHIKSADLEIYPQLGQVKIQQQIIHLRPVNMKVLLVLLQHHGQVVSRTEIFDAVWKNQVISDDALTRSISDLRTQFNQYSQHTLIKTIPKKGYQWIPNVENSSDTQNQKFFKVNWTLILFIIALLITGSLYRLLNSQYIHHHYTQMVLMPIQSTSIKRKSLAHDIEDSLRDNILKTEHIRLLANSLTSNQSTHSFIYLSQEFEVNWVIEGRIRNHKDMTRVTLSLIDARTALEVYSLTSDTEPHSQQVNKLCLEFISNIEKLLEL